MPHWSCTNSTATDLISPRNGWTPKPHTSPSSTGALTSYCPIIPNAGIHRFAGARITEKARPELDIPFIIVSGTIGEETAVSAMQLGAADYLLKDRITRLGRPCNECLGSGGTREYRQLQAQFIEAQKMEVVGHLAGGVAHDFNNVLAVIMGYIDLIIQDLGPSHALQKYADEIQHAAKRAAGLTQQLLIFSRKQTVQTVELDLNDVVKDMEKMLHRLVNENIEMTINCGPNVGLIKADSGYIWQLVMNLVVNARDAMLNGGKLSIETKAVTLNNDLAQAQPGATTGDYAMLSVSDTGIGMTDEIKQRLFEAFFTTKAAGKGTGLGLVTCQTIVRQCGGHIDVISEVGKGTTFKVYFPRLEQTSKTEKRSLPEAGPIKRGSEVVLVVEDDPFLRNLAQNVLKAQGYSVLTATNGQDALRMAPNRGPTDLAGRDRHRHAPHGGQDHGRVA